MAIGDGNVLRDHIKPKLTAKRACYNAADFVGTVALAAVAVGIVGAMIWGLAALIAEAARAVM